MLVVVVFMRVRMLTIARRVLICTMREPPSFIIVIIIIAYIVCLVVFCFVSSFLAYLLSLVRLCSNLWFIHCGWLKCAHTMAERARAMSDYGVSAARPVRSDVRNFFPQSHWIFNSFFFFFLLFLLLFLCSFITYIHYFFFIHHSAALIFIHHTCNSVNVCPSVRCVLCVRVRVQWY